MCRIKPRILDCRRGYSFIKQGFQELGRKGCGVNFETASVEDNKAEQYLTFNQSFMKTFASFAFAGMLALLSISANAAVWRVNNNPVVDADFNAISTAISTAAVGDTIYLEGSVTSYGAMSVTKQLTIIGTGYFITENDSTQAFQSPSLLSSVTISSAANGTVLTGLQVQASFSSSSGGLIRIQANDVTIDRCYLYNTVSQGDRGTVVYIEPSKNNVTIKRSFIYRDNGNVCCSDPRINIDVQSGSTNIYILNNIIKNGMKGLNITNYTSRAIRLANNATAVIQGNVINGVVEVYNSIYNNNIHIAGNYSELNMIQVAHNIGNATQYGTANGNQSSVDMSTVFEYGPSGENVDNHYMLKAGSPALGAGVSGIDAGAFGGDEPYYLSGIPAIPAVFEATIPTIVTTTSGLNINTKIKAHD